MPDPSGIGHAAGVPLRRRAGAAPSSRLCSKTLDGPSPWPARASPPFFAVAEGLRVSRLRRRQLGQVDDVACRRHFIGLDRRDLLGVAGLDPLRRQGMDRSGELVLVGLRLPRRGHVDDQLARHLQLGFLQLALAGGRKVECVARPQLVRPADGVEHEGLAVRDQRRQPLLGVHHHPGDADDAGFEHRLAQQRVDPVALADGRQ